MNRQSGSPNRALIVAIPGVLAVLLGIAIPALIPTGSELVDAFSRYTVLLSVGVIGSAVLVVQAARLLVRGRWHRRSWLVRLVVVVQGLLLFLGLATSSLLAILKQRAYPIATYTFVPEPENMVRVVGLTALLAAATAGGAALTGLILGHDRRMGASAPRLGEAGARSLVLARVDAKRMLRLAYVLAAIGAAASAIVVGSTGRIPLLSRDVDAVRYTQGSGLGFASLLEYELLSAVFVAGAVAVESAVLRARATRLALATVALLVLVRAERTSLLLGVVVVLIYLQYRGRRLRLRWLLPLAVAGVAGVFVLGLVRYQSAATTASDPRARVVRIILDISPEVREQATVLEVFPDKHPYLGRSAAIAVGSSILPGKALGILGVNKQAVYTDSSREYSRILTQLGGYHNSVKPIRVGLLGELWMGYGLVGLLAGGSFFGGVIGMVADYQPRHRVGLLAKSVMTSLCLLALIMPLAALFPIGLMVVGPLALARRRGGPLLVRVQQSALAPAP